MPLRSTRTLVVLAFLAVSVIWGSTYLAIRIAIQDFPPFLGGAVRFLLAGAILYGVLRARGERTPSAVEWRAAAITGVLYFVIGNGFVMVAEKSVSSGLVSVLVATMPLWATLFERFVGGRVGRLEWAGIALGITGVVVLNQGGNLRASGSGAVLALVAPMGWAMASVVSKRVALPKGAMCTAAQMLSGGAALLLTSRVMGERVEALPSLRAMGAMAYLVVFGSLVGFTAYVYLLRNTRTSVATSYAYVNPVIALVLGVAFAGERIDRAGVVGAVIILAAVLLLMRGKQSTAASQGSKGADDAGGAAPSLVVGEGDRLA